MNITHGKAETQTHKGKAETLLRHVIDTLYIELSNYSKELKNPERFEDDFQHGHALGCVQAFETAIYRLENLYKEVYEK
jgi:hypothetical protein